MTRHEAIRILIADDHLVVRIGLRSMIDTQPDMNVIAEAANGREAVELFRAHKPDITLMDLRMPVMGGVEATGIIHEEFPDARIIVLTTYDGDENIYQALRGGARAYLLKDIPREEFLDDIRAVYEGQYCIPQAVAARLARRLPGPELSARELEVLKLIVEGMSNKEIAAALNITESTIKNHVNSILGKLRVNDRTQAATTALRRGIVTLDRAIHLFGRSTRAHACSDQRPRRSGSARVTEPNGTNLLWSAKWRVGRAPLHPRRARSQLNRSGHADCHARSDHSRMHDGDTE